MGNSILSKNNDLNSMNTLEQNLYLKGEVVALKSTLLTLFDTLNNSKGGLFSNDLMDKLNQNNIQIEKLRYDMACSKYELENANKEYEKAKETSISYKKEVQDIENKLIDKNLTIDSLSENLKKANETIEELNSKLNKRYPWLIISIALSVCGFIGIGILAIITYTSGYYLRASHLKYLLSFVFTIAFSCLFVVIVQSVRFRTCKDYEADKKLFEIVTTIGGASTIIITIVLTILTLP
jgi:hypothetical protein